MTILQTVASAGDYKIVYGSDSCLYLITPDQWVPVESKREACMLAPGGVRFKLADDLTKRGAL